MSPEHLHAALTRRRVNEDHVQTIVLGYILQCQTDTPPPNPLAWALQRLKWIKLNEYRVRVGRRGAGGKLGYGTRVTFTLNDEIDGYERAAPARAGRRYQALQSPPEQLRRAIARQELAKIGPRTIAQHM